MEFTAEDLPAEVLGVASVRDDVLLFVWNRNAVQAMRIDDLCGTATLMVEEALNGETPVRLRAVS
jgi:hypothetical protein